MKKTLLSVASSVAFAAVVALVGCSAPTTVNYDTIESIGAPKVTAKTYAGVVRLTWNVVKGAEKYEIYKDGVLVANYNGTDCVYEDIATTSNNLVDGVKYTYDVVALPKGNYAMKQQDRAVYIKENQTTVTVEAKVPSPEDFKAEYESYFAKFEAEGTEFKTELVSGDTVNLGNSDRKTDYKSYIMVTAPTLPEFGYQIKTYIDVPQPFDAKETTDDVAAFTFTENDAAKVYFQPVLGAGDIKTSVKVIPLSPLYQTTTFETADLHIYTLDITNGTANRTAWYVDSTTVHLEWTPADLNGVYYDPADYSVYGYVNGVYTKVEGKVQVLNPGDYVKDVNGRQRLITQTTYYIEDTVAKGDARKTYYTTLYKEYNYEGWWSGMPFDWEYQEFTETTEKLAWYVNSTTVHLEWKPASFSGVYCDPAEYSVYSFNGTAYKKVEGKVNVWNPGDVGEDMYGNKYVVTKTTYYIEDTVAEGEARKTYYTALYEENGDDWDKYGAFVWQDESSDWEWNWVSDFNASVFNDGKKVRISFTPVAKTDFASMYTVYRTNTNDDSVEKIDGVTAGTYNIYSSGNITEVARFYVDDVVDTKVDFDYTYAVYRQINGRFNKASWDIPVNNSADTARGSIEASVMALDKDAIYNDVFITITADEKDSFTLYRAKTVSNDNILDTIKQVKNFEEVKVTSALWGNTSGEYYVMDKDLDDGYYVYKVEFSGTDKKSSEEFYAVTTGANYVSGPVYVGLDNYNGKVVVEDYYRKNSETFSNYTYSYKILARTYKPVGTDSDTSYTARVVSSGNITLKVTDYTSLDTTIPVPQGGYDDKDEWKYPLYYTYYNPSFDNLYDGSDDANNVYVSGTAGYERIRGDSYGVELVVHVTKTNSKTGVTNSHSVSTTVYYY